MRIVTFLLLAVTFVRAQLVDSTRSTSLQEIPVYIRPLTDESITKRQLRGFIEFNTLTKAAQFRKSEDDFNSKFSGLACLSVEDDHPDDCSSLIKIDRLTTEAYLLDITAEGKILGVYERQNHKSEATDSSSSVQVSQVLSVSSPRVRAPIKLVDNKVPEQPVEKTFIQKYWIYIVPFLLLMMVQSGQQQQGQQASN